MRIEHSLATVEIFAAPHSREALLAVPLTWLCAPGNDELVNRSRDHRRAREGDFTKMGEVIRKDASVDDIATDTNTTLKNAAARGGAWKTLAEEKLGPCVTLLNKIIADARSAEETVSVIQAEIDAFDQRADKFLGNKSDEMWNLLGRPGFDPWFTLIWPGGYAVYAEGTDDEQPDRMDLLAELLEAGIHPGLDSTWAKATAQAVRAEATGYRAKVEAARGPRAKAKLLGKMRTTLARAAQMELARLKRRYQAEGFTEAEIHQVIPAMGLSFGARLR